MSTNTLPWIGQIKNKNDYQVIVEKKLPDFLILEKREKQVNNSNEISAEVKEESKPARKAPGYTIEDLDNLFVYHAPKGDQAERYGKISLAAKEFARVVLENTPACADQTVAIRQIALARMQANASIAINE